MEAGARPQAVGENSSSIFSIVEIEAGSLLRSFLHSQVLWVVL